MYNEMYNMIDRKTFKAIVDEYGAGYENNELKDSVIDEMLDKHVKEKLHIFKLFGNKLKVEREIETSISHHELTGLKRQFTLSEALSGDRKIFVRTFLNDISVEEFGDNVVCCDRSYFNIKIAKGMKVSKALARLCLPEDVHSVQTEHSMILQKTKAKGKIVLSIDPCDYVTMSSNNSGWRSCHRLNGGEYRTGPIAYLRDSSSVICYVESSRKCTFNYLREEYEHSNKTWRQIALVSPALDFSMQERQYPATNSINAGTVADMFKELFENFHQDKQFEKKEVEVRELNELHVDYASNAEETALYYNDTIHEMYSYGYVVRQQGVTLGDLADRDDEEKPHKGEAVMCLACGYDVCEDSDTLYCCDCRTYEDDEDEW